ncbi:10743_t:CDS:2 [Dentiscutata erythropus]|uniref:10743_t:CDS:1 n=1 Tax=Dentiscutata erythropus TaxID=1348616 RepID=A0A9N9H3B7_9GLOM|nr:10743_t:CDS:2 [Dentiscutata erythropus]
MDSNENIISIEENKEIKEETIAYLTARLAVNANNIYYSTVSVEYSSTSPLNDKGPSGFVTIYNMLNIEDYINDNEQDLSQEQELSQEQIQRKKQIQDELKKSA